MWKGSAGTAACTVEHAWSEGIEVSAGKAAQNEEAGGRAAPFSRFRDSDHIGYPLAFILCLRLHLALLLAPCPIRHDGQVGTWRAERFSTTPSIKGKDVATIMWLFCWEVTKT